MRFAMSPDKTVPHLAVNEDTGNFVYAVSKIPGGNGYMAEGQTCTWPEYMRIFSKVTGRVGRYEQVSVEQMVEDAPDRWFGEEIAEMFAYSDEPGYDGGDETLLKAAVLREVCRRGLPLHV